MIADFYKQTTDTIADFLATVGNRKDIFSIYSFIYPGMEDYTVCFYATKHEIVLICIDNVNPASVEFADSGLNYLATEDFKLFRKVDKDGNVSTDDDDCRQSPAQSLFFAAIELRSYLASHHDLVPAIHCMLLTCGTITNYPQVVKTWQQSLCGFSALHQIKDLTSANIYNSRIAGHPLIAINEDLSIEGAEYWVDWKKYAESKGYFDWLRE